MNQIKNGAVQRMAYKTGEVAALLGVGERTVRDLMDNGKLRYVRLAGGQRIIPAAAIDEYLTPDKTKLSDAKPQSETSGRRRS